MHPQPSHITRARHIQRTLGTRTATFLRNRRWSIEAALHILVTRRDS